MSGVEKKSARSDTEPSPALPVSPSTGLDPEVRGFLSRIMAGYESAHRTIVEMAQQMSRQTQLAQEAAAKALQMQMQLTEERELLQSKRHQRQMEMLREKNSAEVHAALGRDLSGLVKLAIKRWAGIPLTGDDSHGLQDFLQSMSPDQVSELMSTGQIQLTEVQRIQLANVFGSLLEAEQKKAELAEPRKTSLPEPKLELEDKETAA